MSNHDDSCEAQGPGELCCCVYRAEIAQLRGLLRTLEWSGIYSYDTGWSCCPLCKGIEPTIGKAQQLRRWGHFNDCQLKALGDE